MASSQLIPGLPNDLAIQCLVFLPAKELVRVQKVSPLWKIAITSDRFYVQRRLKAPFPSIFTIRRIRNRYECLDADVADLMNPRLLFSCALHVGQKLFPPGIVFASLGTHILALAPGHQVQKFSLLTRRWTPVSKTLPPLCRLLATRLGSRVVVVACKKQKHHDDDDDDDDDDAPHRHDRHSGDNGDDDGAPQPTMCQIFDSHNHWVTIDGLPEDFYITHCFTCQDTSYVKGMASARSSSVYVLNLTKGRWEEDLRMRDALQYVPHDSKVITKGDVVLMARQIDKDMVSLYHQRANAADWLNVTKVHVRSSGEFFLLKEDDEQIFFAVPDVGVVSWWSQTLFYYQGLMILHIPCDELLLVDSIAG